ncbi:M48 family metallopeptidase [Dokdonia sp. Hel_I_53]|uniref:M48 family metallopeptidase n=1 Tax=Dokdonia sp. Hel_I_53 TaxID=1566287 RepID=UPI0011999968|nr:M48 family metallopeptidase [Dokdonia sp. Hel_I_53]TVZ50889.1 peptidase M48-like protein [Dokdonia sp. Hel_I_53]
MNTKNTLIAILTIFLVCACKTSPFTGKKTLNFVSNDQLFPMAFQQYDAFLSENNVITGTPEANMVKRVGERIAVASEKYMTALGYPGYLSDYRWEYNLVKDEAVNAWCMPGGKIVVYTGILPVTQSETGLAMVMGHELAHALADHGAQRMSAAQVQQLGAVGVAVATSGSDPARQQQIMQLYGVGSAVGGMLPFSRSHETQADEIGIVIAAIAGYNPDEAANLWRRMKEKSGGQSPPQILSTHPSSDSRIANLTAKAPMAKAEAAKFGVTTFK